MPNINLDKAYKRGRTKEYAVIRELKKEGYGVAQRTANSRSPFDIIAINTKENKIKLVQVKSPIPISAQEKIMINNRLLNGEFSVMFEVWTQMVYFDRMQLVGKLKAKANLKGKEYTEYLRLEKIK